MTLQQLPQVHHLPDNFMKVVKTCLKNSCKRVQKPVQPVTPVAAQARSNSN